MIRLEVMKVAWIGFGLLVFGAVSLVRPSLAYALPVLQAEIDQSDQSNCLFDSKAPGPVKRLTVIETANGYAVWWIAQAEPDLAQIQVYNSLKPDLQGELIAQLGPTDRPVAQGKAPFFSIRLVDRCGNINASQMVAGPNSQSNNQLDLIAQALSSQRVAGVASLVGASRLSKMLNLLSLVTLAVYLVALTAQISQTGDLPSVNRSLLSHRFKTFSLKRDDLSWGTLVIGPVKVPVSGARLTLVSQDKLSIKHFSRSAPDGRFGFQGLPKNGPANWRLIVDQPLVERFMSQQFSLRGVWPKDQVIRLKFNPRALTGLKIGLDRARTLARLTLPSLGLTSLLWLTSVSVVPSGFSLSLGLIILVAWIIQGRVQSQPVTSGILLSRSNESGRSGVILLAVGGGRSARAIGWTTSDRAGKFKFWVPNSFSQMTIFELSLGQVRKIGLIKVGRVSKIFT